MADGTEGFRLRSIRLKNQLSQGLVLPISVLNPTDTNIYVEPFEGLDVTEMLGIIKYEAPIPAELAGKVKGLFPSFLRKTDAERIQNLTSEYEGWKNSDKRFYVTEKLDGSSATFYFKDGEFGVCSRNLELLETEGNTFWKVARQLDLENKMRDFGLNISIQGELIGSNVNGNIYKLNYHDVKFFNVFDIDNQEYYDLDMYKVVCDRLGVETVPILDEKFKLPDNIDVLLLQAEGKSVINENTDREGLVIRSLDRKISFKVISNKFLLKNE
jgi:RNA ligase (TIGR02306 family)